jgi:O-antigen/teichoic acid export membrane protein
MHDGESKLRTHRGLAWVGLASSLVTLLDALASWIILRAWISPAELGVATLAASLFPILDLATDMGLTSAVIQKEDHTPERIATVFWLNLAMSLVLAALLFPAGWLLAAFHGHAVLAPMLAAYGGKLIYQNVYAIPSALMKRELRFKELSLIRIVANLGEFGGKIAGAAAGLGVWTFVVAPFVRVFLTGVGTQVRHPWRPRFVVRVAEARGYLEYGLKTSASQILYYFYTTADYQVVGKFFGATALGYYRWATELVLQPVRIISGVVIEIAFPVFARLRRRREALVEQLIAFTRQNLVVAAPFLAVMGLGVEEILVVLLGPAWAGAAPAARILCAVGLLRAMSFVMPPLLDGIGRPTLTLIYMLVAAILLPASFVAFAAAFGPAIGYLSVAVAWSAAYPVAFVVLAHLTLRQIELPARVYLRRIGGILGCAAAALAAGLLTRHLTLSAPAGVRLLAVVVVTLATIGLLLAYVEGISPRSVVRALRGAEAARAPGESLPPVAASQSEPPATGT